MVVGRYAPSPTGFMHYGNAAAALASWLDVRARGGKWLLRIEDLDTERCRPEYIEALKRDIHWMGLEWDHSEPIFVQSERHKVYEEALATLERQGLTYHCFCTRAQLSAIASAPQEGDGNDTTKYRANPCELLSCSQIFKNQQEGRRSSVRLKLPDIVDDFEDIHFGWQSASLREAMGTDPILRRSDGMWAYQLAVSVDDALQGVNLVTRGVDLMPSAHVQRYIINSLGYEVPRYAHIPLLMGLDGMRLAKRNGGNGKYTIMYAREEERLEPMQFIARILSIMGVITPEIDSLSLDEAIDFWSRHPFDANRGVSVI
ncbi:MAG: tRNA glutamyl-Q(34) synthetase GluQRS [Bacteroidia bacterium]|nr:tRNA glutamyl-Q(34) synthetase GluQRS [Bacteroidia bacterium]